MFEIDKFPMIAGGVLVAILLRACTSLHPYSGQHTPPMFGDFEAQRHWMEITFHLPIKDWYKNTTENDLMYWGLDYPPLTAYHSWICGYFANEINPDFVALNSSRGFESADLKLFMRYTVLLADILVFIPAICFYYFMVGKLDNKPDSDVKERKSVLKKTNSDIYTGKSKSKLEKPMSNSKQKLDGPTQENFPKKILRNSGSGDFPKPAIKHEVLNGEHLRRRDNAGEINTVLPPPKKIKNVTFSSAIKFSKDIKTRVKNFPIRQSLLMALLYPGLILIDHGHFQYNCISLGLAVFSVTFILIDHYVMASFCFTLALNYKHMELYHSLPFFFYLLNVCTFKPGSSRPRKLWRLLCIGCTVLGTFLIVWLPFLNERETALQVLHRLFPFERGVFEDKVSNYWCFMNVFVKLKNVIGNDQMAKYCMITTLLTILPSCIDLLFRANKQKFVIALINCSLAFYLFSFQVHEKSILIVAMPIMLYFHNDPFACFWFLYISCFSMLPLFVKDQLLIAYVALVIFYLTAYRLLTKRTKSLMEKRTRFGRNPFIRDLLITLLNVNDGDKDYTDLVTLSFRHLMLNMKLVKQFFIKLGFVLSVIGSICLFFLLTIFDPPSDLPDLFSLLISLYCFGHFSLFFIYFNYRQLFENETPFQSKLKKS